jgi:hypothetical protein
VAPNTGHPPAGVEVGGDPSGGPDGLPSGSRSDERLGVVWPSPECDAEHPPLVASPPGHRNVPATPRFINRIKQYRRVATRYEKTARNFLGFVHVAAIMVLLI